jgi:hypothetical protein
VLPGGDIGGDAQVSESFSVRFHYRDRPGAMVAYCYYAAIDLHHPATISVERQTEYLVCTDPNDPGGTEVWSTHRSTPSSPSLAMSRRPPMPPTRPPSATWSARSPGRAGRPGRKREKGNAVMWTAIWTLLGFLLSLALLLFLDDAILAFAAEQLRERRPHRLQLERERTKQALIANDRDTLIWRGRELENASSSEQTSEPR